MTSTVLIPLSSGRGRRPLMWLAGAAAVAVFAVAVLLARGWRPMAEPASAVPAYVAPQTPLNAEMEEKFGVRFTAVVLTGSEGIIELRYQVLDESKSDVLHDEDTPPAVLIGGRTLDTPALAGHTHDATADAGHSGFVLLANTEHAVQRGDLVSLRVDDLTLDGVVVG